MQNPGKWYSRKHLDFLGSLLCVMGFVVAIIFLPVPALSLVLFALIAGPGIFIAYKRKTARIVVVISFCIVSWGYFGGVILFGAGGVPNAFVEDFVLIASLIALGALPFTWIWRLRTSGNTVTDFFFTWFWCMAIILPFVGSGMLDYNVRADASLPEVISMKVLHRNEDDELGCRLRVETLDGSKSLWLQVSHSFYVEHDIGSMVEVTVRQGALGYPWSEGYQ